jgi:hypothetical protein
MLCEFHATHHEDQSNESDNQKNDNIQYKLSDSEEWISVTVLGKAGKMTGKNKTWYNVQDHLCHYCHNSLAYHPLWHCPQSTC